VARARFGCWLGVTEIGEGEQSKGDLWWPKLPAAQARREMRQPALLSVMAGGAEPEQRKPAREGERSGLR